MKYWLGHDFYTHQAPFLWNSLFDVAPLSSGQFRMCFSHGCWWAGDHQLSWCHGQGKWDVQALSLCMMPFYSASVSLLFHLCLKGKSAGDEHDKLLLGTGRGLLACLCSLPPDSAGCGPAEMVISPYWGFASVSEVKALFKWDMGWLLHRLLPLAPGMQLSCSVTCSCWISSSFWILLFLLYYSRAEKPSEIHLCSQSWHWAVSLKH